jgi:hypothetical protein
MTTPRRSWPTFLIAARLLSVATASCTATERDRSGFTVHRRPGS